MQLADTHCHLFVEQFDQDLEAVIQRAKKAGVERILVPGLDLASSRAAVTLAQENEMIYAAVGVHPNSGMSWEAGSLDAVEALAGSGKAAAIGEIGLDYYRDHAPQHLQRKIFRQQLELAAKLGLPVVIHNRESFQDMLPILQEWHQDLVDGAAALAEKPGVLHSFSEDLTAAEQILELGFFIGFTGPVTFKNALELQQVAATIPLDRLLIETDAPYLTPHPFRGKRNEPGYVYYVAEKIAELRGLAPEEVGEISTNNAKILFNW